MKLSAVKSLFLLFGMLILTACATAPVSDDKTAVDDEPLVENATPKVVKTKPAPVKGFDPIVLFDFDKSVIRESEAGKILGQAEKIKKEKTKAVVVEGHTDPIGTKEYNIALGERRANSTKNALVKSGVNKDIVEVVSYGKSRLVDTSNTPEGNAKNRRTVTVLK
ncbi:MAG: OmpA family protein [Alphaproteobacteria bacterium]|jgi:outer membrane protein OmpA-like peptidoglycan-associated protein|nr:OmpA family protein [Alphaproteobacteria bacterium]